MQVPYYSYVLFLGPFYIVVVAVMVQSLQSSFLQPLIIDYTTQHCLLERQRESAPLLLRLLLNYKIVKTYVQFVRFLIIPTVLNDKMYANSSSIAVFFSLFLFLYLLFLVPFRLCQLQSIFFFTIVSISSLLLSCFEFCLS